MLRTTFLRPGVPTYFAAIPIHLSRRNHRGLLAGLQGEPVSLDSQQLGARVEIS
jgi:hypothetical protein